MIQVLQGGEGRRGQDEENAQDFRGEERDMSGEEGEEEGDKTGDVRGKERIEKSGEEKRLT